MRIRVPKLTRSQWIAVGSGVSAIINTIIANHTQYHLTTQEMGVLVLIAVGCRSILPQNSGAGVKESSDDAKGL